MDSSKRAVGGTWRHINNPMKNIIWRLEWPLDIQQNLVSPTNPKGTISINDLEMAGILLAWLVLENSTTTPLTHKHISIFCDNMSTVHWTNKQSSTTSVIAAYLIRALAFRQHVHRTSPLITIHIPGKENLMADAASRSFDDTQFTKSNKSFFDTFISIFSLQKNSWEEYTLPNKIFLRVISCLRGQQLAMESWQRTTTKGTNTGNIGNNTQLTSKLIHTYQTVTTQKKSSSLQPMQQESEQVAMEEETLSKPNQSQMHWQPSPQPLNWLENHPQSTKQTKNTKSQWHRWWKDSDKKTHLQHHK